MTERLISQLNDFAGDRDGYGYDLARQASETIARQDRHIKRLTSDLEYAIGEVGDLTRLIVAWSHAEDEAYAAARRSIKSDETKFFIGQLERYRNMLREAVGR